MGKIKTSRGWNRSLLRAVYRWYCFPFGPDELWASSLQSSIQHPVCTDLHGLAQPCLGQILPGSHLLTIPILSLLFSDILASLNGCSWIGEEYIVLASSSKPSPCCLPPARWPAGGSPCHPLGGSRVSLWRSMKVTYKNWMPPEKQRMPWKGIHQQNIE